MSASNELKGREPDWGERHRVCRALGGYDVPLNIDGVLEDVLNKITTTPTP